MAGGRRSWAVLGEMLELGEASPDEHAALGRLAVERGVDRLVVVGEGARDIARGAAGAGRPEGEECRVVPDVEVAFSLLAQELRDGDVVLLKSSRDAGLRWLGERVAAEGEPAGEGRRR
jgi:UDP-N-acetylmuramoyl-tripeptide--D-alanyl-D-alanine ligase